jgi:transcriptional adapter 2-alpha
MPKREDFDQEYEEEANSLIEHIEFVYYSDDNEQDIQYKNDVINLFNNILDERIKRKKFVIERGILDPKKPVEKK